jgi:hypothetical protein
MNAASSETVIIRASVQKIFEHQHELIGRAGGPLLILGSTDMTLP